MSKNILFVLHDAALTGAPMVLLHLTRWIKENTDVRITVLFKEGGPLQEKFEALGDVYIWRPGQLSGSISRRAASKINTLVKKAPLHIPYPKKLKSQKFNLVYLNTADTTGLAPRLKEYYSCPIIAHIHELSYSIKAYYPEAFSHTNKAAIDYYIAASKGVADNLTSNYKIDPDKISVLNEFIPVNKISKPTISYAAVKSELGVTGKFVVGGSGSAGWRKGTDRFIQIAYLINKKLPVNNLIFLWIGNQSVESAAQSEYEIERTGLKGKIIFTGSKPDPQDYFQVFDLFALTSREDPFPLVALEAMALKKPVYCFQDSGGIPDIVTDGTGKTIAYGDVEAMANEIIEASKQPENTFKKGENAFKLIGNYDVAVIAPKIFSLINSYAN